MRSLFAPLFAGALVSLVGAASYSAISVDQIASMQLRADGQYSVMCKDNTFEVVTAADVQANNVCPYVEAPKVAIKDGSYKSLSPNLLCDQKLTSTYSNGVLTAVRIDFPSCSCSFIETTCVGNVCTGVSCSQTVEVTIHDDSHYTWANLTNTYSKGDFEWMGALNLPVLYSTPATGKGAVGTR